MRIGLVMPVSWDPLIKYLPKGVRLPQPLIYNSGAEFALGLRDAGHEVHIFTLCHHFDGEQHVTGDKIHLHIGGYRQGAWKYTLDFFRVEERRLAKMIRNYPCDILHAHWTYEFALPVVKSKTPHIVSVRDAPLKVLWFYRPKSFRIMTCLLAYYTIAKANCIITASPYMANYCRKWHNYKREINVIPNGVADRTFALANGSSAPDEKIGFACIANGFRGCKNVDMLLRAFNILQQDSSVESELRLYGGQHARGGESETWAKQNHLSKNVVFCGQLPHADLMKEIRARSHVLVHPSLEESFGNVIAEAMALGLPTIVGNRSGAAPWVAGMGEAGLLVDVRNKYLLAAAMKKMVEGPALRKRMGMEAEKIARLRYSLSGVVQQHCALYERIANETK